MKVLVIGASGRVGKILSGLLLSKQHQVIGTTRKKEPLFEDQNYEQISLDLTEELSVIKDTLPKGLDAICFVSGSRGENLLQVDLDGAIKTMKAAEDLGVGRYVMLSSIFSLDPSQWKGPARESLFDYMIAKHYADLWLIDNTDLNYTILQPGGLKEIEGSRKIDVDVKSAGENSIENVAHTLLEILKNDNTIKKVISMKDGEQPIEEAVANF